MAKWPATPHMDALVAYVNSPEGDFRIKIEAYAGMINIVSALLITISLPAFLNIDDLNMDQSKDTFVVAFYGLLCATIALVIALMSSATFLISGMSFTGNDIDTLALITAHYPGATLRPVSLLPLLHLPLGEINVLFPALSHTDTRASHRNPWHHPVTCSALWTEERWWGSRAWP